jgi:hypothetical protein
MSAENLDNIFDFSSSLELPESFPGPRKTLLQESLTSHYPYLFKNFEDGSTTGEEINTSSSTVLDSYYPPPGFIPTLGTGVDTGAVSIS